MASVTLTVTDRFPDDTVVGAYSKQPAGDGKPVGAPVTTATVSGGELSFTGLTAEQPYVAVAQVNGVWTRYAFSTFTTPGPLVNGKEVALKEDAQPFTDKTVEMSQSSLTATYINFRDGADQLVGLIRRLGAGAIGLVTSGIVEVAGDDGVALVSETGVNVTAPYLELEASVLGTATAAPASGAHVRGEIVFRSDPSAGGKIGWVCVTAGSPGTWKPWGAIDA